MSILIANEICFSYEKSKDQILKNVSFVIEKGSYTAIVGSNGSGKSTLARILCGLEQSYTGTLKIEQGYKIGLVFQSPKNQIVSGVVSRDTAFGPQNLGLKDSEVELRTIECLNIVDLLDKATSSSSALSLGQTQKLALSGMLALWPEILILDESVSMLDPESRKDIFEFLEYWNKSGNTIIHITHEEDAINHAENVLLLEKGQVLYYGKKTAFLQKEEFTKNIFGPKLQINPRKKIDSECVLSFSDVCFEYDKKNRIENINFSLQKGTITALTGPSGAGKSTILEVTAGLLEKKSGQIKCNSKPLLVQQNSQAALFEKFAADDVAFGPRNNGLSGKSLKTCVKESMQIVNLPFEEFADRHTFLLSGGEQRRLSIAGIIAMNQDIILFDEPTAGLDGNSRYKIMMMMKQLAEQGKTILFSTHHKDEADFADREICIQNGQIYSDSNKVQNESNNLQDFVPYSSTKLLQKLNVATSSFAGTEKNQKSKYSKLPSVARILIFLVLFVLSLIFRNPWICGSMLLVTLIYSVIAGFSIKRFLVSCVKIMPFLLIFAVFQMIFHPSIPGEPTFTSWKWFLVTPSKLMFCFTTILRTLSALGCISAFFVSTPEYDLIDGLKKLLKPLNLLKIPVKYFILIMEIIFRFIPLLVEEASCIIKTQLIRGALGQKKGKLARIKAMIPLVVPLIIQTLKRSEALADAITMRYFK